MEAATLQPAAPVAEPRIYRVRRPLWLNSDEQLVALVREGSDPAFEALVGRYHSRLLTFCAQILRSNSDAEDVLQDTFIAALNAMRADARPIDVKPWLYRIARNRCLNHRRSIATGRAGGLDRRASEDTLAARPADGGISAAERVARKEDFRLLVSDIGELPEQQRSALLLRELDGLSYNQVAGVLETSVPSVKSLLVRARGSLVEASEARGIPCDDARQVLTQAAEGLVRVSAPVRSHIKRCDDCRAFKGHLKKSTKLVAAISPVGPLVSLKALLLTKLGAGATGSAGTAGGAGVATTVGATTGVGAAAKAVVGVAAVAALITGPADIKPEVRDRPPSGAPALRADPAQQASVGRVRPFGASPSAPPATTDRESPVASGPAADIQSSSLEPAAPESAPGRPADAAESPHGAPPGTRVRGRPAPGLNGGRRTRPPPDSAGDRTTVIEPQAPPAEPPAPSPKPPVPSQDAPPISGEPTSGVSGEPSAP